MSKVCTVVSCVAADGCTYKRYYCDELHDVVIGCAPRYSDLLVGASEGASERG